MVGKLSKHGKLIDDIFKKKTSNIDKILLNWFMQRIKAKYEYCIHGEKMNCMEWT